MLCYASSALTCFLFTDSDHIQSSHQVADFHCPGFLGHCIFCIKTALTDDTMLTANPCHTCAYNYICYMVFYYSVFFKKNASYTKAEFLLVFPWEKKRQKEELRGRQRPKHCIHWLHRDKLWSILKRRAAQGASARWSEMIIWIPIYLAPVPAKSNASSLAVNLAGFG